jgi:hypothetical protein
MTTSKVLGIQALVNYFAAAVVAMPDVPPDATSTKKVCPETVGPVTSSTETTPLLSVLVVIDVLGSLTTLWQSAFPECNAMNPLVNISTQIPFSGAPVESVTVNGRIG